MVLAIQDIHPFHQLLISIVLGLIVGLQREWSESPVAGIRSFALIALFGTVCAFTAEKYGDWVIMTGFIGIFIIILASLYLHKFSPRLKFHSSPVTELAMLLIYLTGVLVKVGPIWLAASVAGALAFILQAKIELHGLAKRFSEFEIKAIMQFVLISLVILPIIPNQTFGPLNVLNPHETWLMVMVIVGISLTGYIVYKFWGEKAGMLLSGILGGVISSTATTVSYSKKTGEISDTISVNAIIILIAWTTVYVRLILEIFLVAPAFQSIWIPLSLLFIISAISTLWIWKFNKSSNRGMLFQDNPSELKTAFAFGIIYSIVLLAVAYSKEYFGSRGLSIVAVLSGITDMDAITLSTARLVQSEKLVFAEGSRIIVLACISNLFFKGLIARIIGGRALFRVLLIPWLFSLITGGIILIVM